MKRLLRTVLCTMMTTLLTVSARAEEILLIAPAPKTGDRMNMPLLIGLIVAAAVAIIVLVIIMIRNSKKQ